MPSLNVFERDAFSVLELTSAIMKLPFKPSKLKELGIFQTKGVRTTTVEVEEKQGVLYLIPATARGSNIKVQGGKIRQVRAFRCPHIALSGEVLADDVQNVRSFGTEDEMEAVNDIVNDKLTDLRQSIEYTQEWYRIGAIQGKVLDADMSTVMYNWFTEFGITEPSVSTNPTFGIDFSGTSEDASKKTVKIAAHNIKRTVQDALGMTPYSQIAVVCGAEFFDALTTCEEVKKAYDRYQESLFLRTGQARGEFEYAEILWLEYRGKLGTTPFFPTDQGRVVPLGVPDLFLERFAPADYVETVNTIGLPVYAKQELLRMGKGVEFEVQSNPLYVCTRPSVLIKLTMTGS